MSMFDGANIYSFAQTHPRVQRIIRWGIEVYFKFAVLSYLSGYVFVFILQKVFADEMINDTSSLIIMD